jgi:hypothetical protein
MNTFINAKGTSSEDSFFEQATQITKAHAYDIAIEQVKELKLENEQLRARVIYLEDLIKEYTAKMMDDIEKITGKYYGVVNEKNETNRAT